MCTGLTLSNGDVYFGRNLDLNYDFGQQVVITPRNYPITYKAAKTHEKHFAMIGMAVIVDDYPLYAEAMNEKGLGIAGLNFPGYAKYNKEKVEGIHNITPYEIIPWILAQFETVENAKEALQNLNMYQEDFKQGVGVSPLHWIISDKNNKSIVLECSEGGVKVTDNPVGILTNNPKIDYHLENLKNYTALSAKQPENSLAPQLDLPPFGQGLGGFGVPGDFSPSSRFVKAVYLKENSQSEKDEMSNVTQFFHILDGVAMIRGAVETPEGNCDITMYSCCMNARTGDFYYKTYNNNQISLISMSKENLDSKELIHYPLEQKQQIHQVN